MTRRYFVPDLSIPGGLTTLPDAESQHAIRVMRVKVGDLIELFDGKGNQAEATITQLTRNDCHCESRPAATVDREPARAIHLGIALPKPERARELIERLTELGVKTVTPLVADRSQRPPSDSVIEKLRRGVVEACKQCGRNQLLEIRPTVQAANFFSEAAGSKSTTRWIAHPAPEAMSPQAAQPAREITAAIGPEGGWTDAEFHLAIEHGFQPIQLGKRIYRIETAATVIAAVLTIS
jgi:16S rRNA (uracil1498-N3)-methyltransferase